MNRNSLHLALCALVALTAVAAGAQERSLWRTATDIREGVRGGIVGTVVDADNARRQLRITPDDDPNGRVTVLTDSVATQYHGFGGMINGSPEIFTGSSGFGNVRAGDRVDVRGFGRGNYTMMAEQVALLGRSVDAPQTGVGTTRSGTTVSTPTATSTAASAAGRVEGVVRQVNREDFRIVIETDRREMLTVRGTSSTPVYFRNETFRISNLDPGDRVRVELDSGSTTGNELRARVIDVLQSVQQRGGTDSSARVTSISGRVTRIDRPNDFVTVETSRGASVRVDVSDANDGTGRRIRASDLQVSDRVTISGSYGRTSDTFLATTVRYSDDVFSAPDADDDDEADDDDDRNAADEMVLVTIYGTVRETLASSPQLVIRDTQNNRTVRIHVVDDFAVRTKTGTYSTADKLREGEAIVVRAYRDAEQNYVAQTIRMR